MGCQKLPYYDQESALGVIEDFFEGYYAKKESAQKKCTDYYPFGAVARTSKTNEENHYRYGYQGEFSEEDEETGWNSFQLRQYDPVIGRWTSTDPYRQFASPYVGMANNPINGVDPDGGCFTTDADGNRVPCPDAEVGSRMTGVFGYEWTFGENGWDLPNATSISDNLAVFTAAPEDVIGTDAYYDWRYVEHIEKYGTRPPDYYLGYGSPNLKLFTELSSSLSSSGAQWVSATRLELQVLMEAGLQNNPAMELHGAEFHSFAFDTHVPAYTKGGTLRGLSFSDKWQILWTPKASDVFSLDGLRQIWNIWPKIQHNQTPSNIRSYYEQ